jgi:uncharacterized protein
MDNSAGNKASVAVAPAASGNGRLIRRLASISRWLHLYFSMASFALVFFFAATGITLNHQEWFARQQRTALAKGRIDTHWTRASGGGEAAKLEIVEHLRNTHGIHAALSDFRLDESQCVVSFRGPGYTADVFIDRETGSYDLTETRMGFGAMINDLHKGRDTGHAWKAMIDVSAVILCLVSFSGLILIFFLHRRRVAGILALGAGALVAYVLYVAFVP